ncbi:type II toxin-antitoxin system PemK/MazF family toxin [Dactylosporangium aurantiacum]|uniref:Type II toxin-antitoxin system PemK/MazF family toxin n=1 Tax=Dactylosporangium aurantiacum TaxID=35754 RepID=A0A9Q9ICV0_9ACTN|nr:type II toxin-antitoxin system PemK/MazF family toxin [Dactylosporangium aurantiacum]
MVVRVKRLLQGLAARLGARRAPAPPPQPAPPPARPQPPQQRATLHKPGPPPRHVSDKLLQYAPQLDGAADPGEVVWTWVQYEDDPSQGKDRPVLVVGRKGTSLVGLMLSSQSERDGQRNWFALGPGSWDRDQRPSWVRLDRVLTVEEHGIRREGAVLDRERFDRIAERLRSAYGWD